MNTMTESPRSASEVFWGEIAPCEHLVQIYADQGAFLDSLEGFVAGGLLAGEGVIVIATRAHLIALDQRLWARGLDVSAARERDQYITLDATEALSKFLVKGWPDEELFERFVTELLGRAGRDGRRVRAFGEMVAVLWARGQSGATIQLEHLWHRFCQSKAFSLFCAYPKSGFTQDTDASIREICAAHSKVIAPLPPGPRPVETPTSSAI